MALQQPRTPVPAENSVVVPRGTNHFGFREAVHRFRKKWGKSVRRAAHAHLRFRPPLVQQTGVVEAFVTLGESLEKSLRFSRTIRGVSAELISDGEAQQAQSHLMFRL